MSSRGILGILVSALVVLAVIYAYNRFSGKNVADLGKQAVKA